MNARGGEEVYTYLSYIVVVISYILKVLAFDRGRYYSALQDSQVVSGVCV